jgi:hypothetical protein
VLRLPGESDALMAEAGDGDAAVAAAGGGGGGRGGGGEDESLSLVAHGERTPYSSISLDTTLHSDGFTSRYLVLPLCFGHLTSPEPRKFAVAALSTQPLSIETVPLSPRRLAVAMVELGRLHGEKKKLLEHPTLGEVLNVYVLEEEAGWIIVGENMSPHLRIRVEVDASERTIGYFSSRGALFSEDVIPPRSRQLLMVLSIDMSKRQHQFALGFGGGALEASEFLPPGAGHIPALDDLGSLAPLHEPLSMGGGAGAGAGGGALAPPPPAGGDVDVSALAAAIMGNMQQQQ